MLSCCGNYTFKYDVPGYARTMCITDWLEKLWMSYLCCANLRQTEGSRMAPGWGLHGTCPRLRVELCAFWGKSALTDLHIFLLAYMKELVTGRKFLLVVNQLYNFLKFYFMTCHEGMGSALDLFDSCPSSKSTKTTKRALQILVLGLIRREPRIMSF